MKLQKQIKNILVSLKVKSLRVDIPLDEVAERLSVAIAERFGFDLNGLCQHCDGEGFVYQGQAKCAGCRGSGFNQDISDYARGYQLGYIKGLKESKSNYDAGWQDGFEEGLQIPQQTDIHKQP